MNEPTITFTKTARIVDGERIPLDKLETVTARIVWVSCPEVYQAAAYAAGWRAYGTLLAARGWR
jgi:hypothetical protein